MIKFKKISYILITIVILGIFFMPFINQKANAANESMFSWKTPMFGFLNPNYFSSNESVQKIAIWVTQNLIWTPATWFMALGGMVMDKGISLSITGSMFKDLAGSSGQDSAVTVGWRLSRDIVNLFLIFILLYIAIATILQISGYGAKELLATLIIIAFVVNFSLVITKLVIDASNILTIGFYNAFTPDTQGQVSISLTFKNALGSEKLINADKAIKNYKGDQLNILLTYLFGATMAFIAGFIFLIFGILFIIRMVVLLMLMVFAPLAFAAYILPSTKKHFSKWWDTLFSQAFWAPAALFMLWFAAKLANSGFIGNATRTTEVGLADMIASTRTEGSTTAGDTFMFAIQFIIVIIVLCASLIIAKQMGAAGAESVQAGLSKAGKKMQGYAGKISKRYTAPVAERLATSEGAFARTIRAIPLATRGLAAASVLDKKEIGKYEKQYSSYSPATLNALSKDVLLNRAQRAAIKNIQGKQAAKEMRKKILGDPKASSMDKIKALLEETEEVARKVESTAKETKTSETKK